MKRRSDDTDRSSGPPSLRPTLFDPADLAARCSSTSPAPARRRLRDMADNPLPRLPARVE